MKDIELKTLFAVETEKLKNSTVLQTECILKQDSLKDDENSPKYYS